MEDEYIDMIVEHLTTFYSMSEKSVNDLLDIGEQNLKGFDQDIILSKWTNLFEKFN